MTTLIIRRVVSTLLTLSAVTVAVFFILHLVPGDPAQAILGEKATPEAIASVHRELGLDQPLSLQFATYVGRIAHGDFGRSIRSGRPITEEISARFPATLELSLIALLMSTLSGVLLGALAARKPGGLLDLFLAGLSVAGLSLPIFFLGLVLILIFGSFFDWFPLSGRLDYAVSYEPLTGLALFDSLLMGDFSLFRSALMHLILPAVALATIPLSLLARLTRATLLEAMKADYIRTARAKGQSEWKIFFRHAFRNALLPIVTMIGFEFGLLLGGAILTEQVFAWPGIGRWIVNAVEGRDYPAVQAGVLFFAFGIVIVMMLTDFVHIWVDPRLRVKGER